MLTIEIDIQADWYHTTDSGSAVIWKLSSVRPVVACGVRAQVESPACEVPVLEGVLDAGFLCVI